MGGEGGKPEGVEGEGEVGHVRGGLVSLASGFLGMGLWLELWPIGVEKNFWWTLVPSMVALLKVLRGFGVVELISDPREGYFEGNFVDHLY